MINAAVFGIPGGSRLHRAPGRKRDHPGEVVRGPTLHAFCILPRSLHRPVAVTEGSLTENTNKTGVRLWTDLFPYQLWTDLFPYQMI
jgi:hypothetical protein